MPISVISISPDDFKNNIDHYFDIALKGEVISIPDKGVFISNKSNPDGLPNHRPMGLAKDDFITPDEFDEQLPDYLNNLFEGI